jgi:HD-GYP domain-containing protein (c-di-GMP phosphodiesterase class II)
MSDSRQLLARITAFRAKLEEVPRLVPAGTALEAPAANPSNRLAAVFREAIVSEPSQLTGRAHRLLTEARDLVNQQKQLADDAMIARSDAADPLARFHRGTIGLTDSALRLALVFPAAAEAQLKMCDGFEHLLRVIRGRLGVLEHAVALRRADAGRIARLADLLKAIQTGKVVSSGSLFELAELILDDARQGARLRFAYRDPATDGVAAFVAAHALNVGQVLARLVPHDYEWALKPALPIVAALTMDVGMLDVPAEILAKPGSLTLEERRSVELHPLRSAERLKAAMPDAGPLAEVVIAHHEQLDGTGYHQGLKADAIAALPRLLAVADGYAARMADRPHRPALDPRAALTETLLEAEAGKLDRDFAEYLMHLSFHPVGTVVELADGRVGVVAAIHERTNLRASLRPVVAVLVDGHGELLPRPEFVDLAAAGTGSIVRAVPAAERRRLLGDAYPDLCL